MVGRDKLRLDDLEDVLRKHDDDGWELVTAPSTPISAGAATGTC